MSPDTRRYRDDILGTKGLRGHSFVSNRTGLVNRFFCEPGGGKELHREAFDNKMLALDAPTALPQVGVDRGYASR
jgi:hypothetical protein